MRPQTFNPLKIDIEIRQSMISARHQPQPAVSSTYTPVLCPHCEHANRPWDKHCGLCRINLKARQASNEAKSPSTATEKLDAWLHYRKSRPIRKSGFPRSTITSPYHSHKWTRYSFKPKTISSSTPRATRLEARLAEIDALMD